MESLQTSERRLNTHLPLPRSYVEQHGVRDVEKLGGGDGIVSYPVVNYSAKSAQ
jgi:hypothetical protein